MKIEEIEIEITPPDGAEKLKDLVARVRKEPGCGELSPYQVRKLATIKGWKMRSRGQPKVAKEPKAARRSTLSPRECRACGHTSLSRHGGLYAKGKSRKLICPNPVCGKTVAVCEVAIACPYCKGEAQRAAVVNGRMLFHCSPCGVDIPEAKE